jgi:hypothetical protein
MTSRAIVEEFVSQRVLAVVGVSRSGKKFGNAVCRELRAKGYRVYALHTQAESIDGEPCYRDFSALPESVGGVVVVVKPDEAAKVVREAAAAGIKRIWLQQGAGSPEAVRFCEAQGMSVVTGECILMFTEPVGPFHGFHRWLWRVFGKLPS